MKHFKNINYLKAGNPKQKQAYQLLTELNILTDLASYAPILVGTIPIDIDIPNSDLDIICTCENHEEFSAVLRDLYADEKGFRIWDTAYEGIKSTVAQFRAEPFDIEIFAQNIPTEKQNAYRHMLIEYEILKRAEASFRSKVRVLKLEGMKTEPAFAKLLGLEGDPYKALLEFDLDSLI